MLIRRTLLLGGLAAIAASLTSSSSQLYAGERPARPFTPLNDTAPDGPPSKSIQLRVDIAAIRRLTVGDRILLPAPTRPGAPPRPPIVAIADEVAHLADGRYTTVWGTFAVPEGAPRTGIHSRGHAYGEFILARFENRLGGLIVDRRAGRPGIAYLLAPTDAPGRSRATYHRVPPLQQCDPRAAENSSDHLWALPASQYAPRTRPPRIVSILFLYTPRAILDTGGCREHFKHCLASALDAAREVFGHPDVNLLLDARGPLPTPDDDAREPLNRLVHRRRPDPRVGRRAAVALMAGADAVLLLAANGPTPAHGYALPGTRRSRGTAVVTPGDLRHDDLTLAHELGHVLGRRHTDTADVMTTCGRHRTRRARPE